MPASAGYQFNAVDASTGLPRAHRGASARRGSGVGTRLMAEAVRYFERHRVWKILLNTEETQHPRPRPL